MAHRYEAFEEVVAGQGPDAHATLVGPGCDEQPWATVPCSPGVAMGGAVEFTYPGERAALVRMSPADRRLLRAEPQRVRIVVMGRELRSVPIRWGGRQVTMLPGDSLTVYL